MRKGWLILLLVLVVSSQLLLFSSFHDVEVDGFASGNSVIGVAKWNYVQGSVHISIIPMAVTVEQNGTYHVLQGNVSVTFPNGTTIYLGSSQYSFVYRLPRTGDFGGNGATSGPIGLSQSQPMNVTVFQNVGDVSTYETILRGEVTTPILPIDLYLFAVRGDAQVVVSGFGMAL